jgi:hypothetical protein
MLDLDIFSVETGGGGVSGSFKPSSYQTSRQSTRLTVLQTFQIFIIFVSVYNQFSANFHASPSPVNRIPSLKSFQFKIPPNVCAKLLRKS